MLFRQLEYFVALAREEHFAKAAESCYVSQPALSEAIRKLEHELSVPLVRRSRTFEGLTPEGDRLVIWARRILADHDALKLEVAALRTGLSGILRLGVVPSASTIAALVLEPLCSLHPSVGVNLETRLPNEEIMRRIRSFELDAGLVYGDGDRSADIRFLPLYSERQLLLVSTELVPTTVTEMTCADVVELPLCLLSTSMLSRQRLDAFFAASNLTLAPQITVDSIAALHALVGTGRWAALVPTPWSHPFRPSADVRAIPVTDLRVAAPLGIATVAAEPVSLLARAFAGGAKSLRLEAFFRAFLDTESGLLDVPQTGNDAEITLV